MTRRVDIVHLIVEMIGIGFFELQLTSQIRFDDMGQGVYRSAGGISWSTEVCNFIRMFSVCVSLK